MSKAKKILSILVIAAISCLFVAFCTGCQQDAVCTITDNYGQTEDLSIGELANRMNDNVDDFEARYYGSKVTATGTVTMISGPTSTNGRDVNGFFLINERYLFEYGPDWDEFASTVKEGDTITGTGWMTSMFPSMEVDCFEDTPNVNTFSKVDGE